MGDGVQIVGVVVRVGVLHVHRGLFQLHEEQGDTVNKAHDVRAPTVQVAVDFQLPRRQKVVLLRVLEVKHCRHSRLRPAAGLFRRHWDAIPDEKILLLVGLHEGGGGQPTLQLLLGLVHLCVVDPRVQPFQRRPKIPRKEDLMVVPPPEGAVLPQDLLVIGKRYLPPQLIPQKIAGALLDENVFGVVVGHRCYLLTILK